MISNLTLTQLCCTTSSSSVLPGDQEYVLLDLRREFNNQSHSEIYSAYKMLSNCPFWLLFRVL